MPLGIKRFMEHMSGFADNLAVDYAKRGVIRQGLRDAL